MKRKLSRTPRLQVFQSQMQDLLFFIVDAFYFLNAQLVPNIGGQREVSCIGSWKSRRPSVEFDKPQIKPGFRLMEVININFLVFTNVVMYDVNFYKLLVFY